MKMVAKNLKLTVSAARHSNKPGCKGKIMFRNEGEARHALAKYKAQFVDDTTVMFYPCTSCGEYHLGHPKPDPEALQVETTGKFLVHEGLTYAKISDPNKVATFWLFVVPPGTPEDEGAVLAKGVLVANKEYKGIWREKDGKRSEYHQIFFLCPTMNHAGSCFDFAERITWHKEHMGDLMQTKMDLLNGVPISTTLGDIAPRIEIVEAPVTETQKAQLVAEQEMHKGRAVFRDAQGRPYHRQYHKCSTEECGCEVELRAYIARDGGGMMTAARGWLPVDSRAVPRPQQPGKRSREWVCGECMGKVTGLKAETVEVKESFVDSLRRKALEEEPPAGYVESCSYCGLPGHWRADCPEIGAMVMKERQVQKQKQAYGWQPSVTVVQNLQKIAQDGALNADFVRGATLLACQLLTPNAGEFRL